MRFLHKYITKYVTGYCPHRFAVRILDLFTQLTYNNLYPNVL